MLLIRAHHLFCIQGYQGYGYDNSFIENMNHIYKLMLEDNECIQLCTYNDDICKKCPNLKDGFCINSKNNAKIVDMDKKVLKIINYNNEKFNSKDLIRLLNKLISKKDILDICGKCMWIDKCLFYQQFLD